MVLETKIYCNLSLFSWSYYTLYIDLVSYSPITAPFFSLIKAILTITYLNIRLCIVTTKLYNQ